MPPLRLRLSPCPHVLRSGHAYSRQHDPQRTRRQHLRDAIHRDLRRRLWRRTRRARPDLDNRSVHPRLPLSLLITSCTLSFGRLLTRLSRLRTGTLGSCHNLNTGYNGFELLERGSNIANDCIRLCEGLGCIGGQILRLSDIPLDECMEATSGPAQSIAFSEPC